MRSATRVIVSSLGVIFGIGGITHGLFETLQGNTPTGGMFILPLVKYTGCGTMVTNSDLL